MLLSDLVITSVLNIIIKNNGLHQIAHFYTNIIETSKAIIDLVLTNNDKVSVCNKTDARISDHETKSGKIIPMTFFVTC